MWNLVAFTDKRDARNPRILVLPASPKPSDCWSRTYAGTGYNSRERNHSQKRRNSSYWWNHLLLLHHHHLFLEEWQQFYQFRASEILHCLHTLLQLGSYIKFGGHFSHGIWAVDQANLELLLLLSAEGVLPAKSSKDVHFYYFRLGRAQSAVIR